MIDNYRLFVLHDLVVGGWHWVVAGFDGDAANGSKLASGAVPFETDDARQPAFDEARRAATLEAQVQAERRAMKPKAAPTWDREVDREVYYGHMETEPV